MIQRSGKTPWRWTGRTSYTVKMSILLKATYRVKATPIKISMTVFTELEKMILKFIRKYKRS